MDLTSLNHLKIYYFDNGTLGRAEPIRLLLEDACVPYTFCPIPYRTWEQFKRDHLPDTPFVLPYIETTAGKRYFGGVPVLRFLAKKLGYSAPDDDDEIEQYLDVVQDYCMDWYNHAIDAIISRVDKGDPAIIEKHEKTNVPKFFGRFERIYALNDNGPYLLGEKMTFVDILVYHTIDDEDRRDKLQDTYPHLDALVKAFEERPRIKAYHDSIGRRG